MIPSEPPSEFHIQGDALEVISRGEWDLLIAHPPCTHLAVSGAAHFHKKRKQQKESLEFFLAILNADVPMVCVENPVSIAGSHIRKATQIIQPWMFGDEAQKSTCLGLKNLPKLKPTAVVDKGQFTVADNGKKYPKWMINKGKHRSVTFSGIANAMADQWGRLDPSHTEGLGINFSNNLVRKPKCD